MNKDNYHKEDVSKEKKPLPIGISDYIRAQAEYYYVDKTLLIKEFLDQKSLVSLFTRPRRFGKTLNMDMLKCFFQINMRIEGSCLKGCQFGMTRNIEIFRENILLSF